MSNNFPNCIRNGKNKPSHDFSVLKLFPFELFVTNHKIAIMEIKFCEQNFLKKKQPHNHVGTEDKSTLQKTSDP